eukprot:Amastigsp_a6162_56.p6 type:complete len:107 gc:universal Amastigsp_a6162_56:1289-1609(+)
MAFPWPFSLTAYAPRRCESTNPVQIQDASAERSAPASRSICAMAYEPLRMERCRRVPRSRCSFSTNFQSRSACGRVRWRRATAERWRYVPLPGSRTSMYFHPSVVV